MTKDRERMLPFFCIVTNKRTQANRSGEGRELTRWSTGLYPAQKALYKGGTAPTDLLSSRDPGRYARYFFHITRETLTTQERL